MTIVSAGAGGCPRDHAAPSSQLPLAGLIQLFVWADAVHASAKTKHTHPDLINAISPEPGLMAVRVSIRRGLRTSGADAPRHDSRLSHFAAVKSTAGSGA